MTTKRLALRAQWTREELSQLRSDAAQKREREMLREIRELGAIETTINVERRRSWLEAVVPTDWQSPAYADVASQPQESLIKQRVVEGLLILITAETADLEDVACALAFDHGIALSRIEALEAIYISVDSVLGGAESKGLLRDVWAKLEIPGRCTHARQPHPFRQLERIECPYPDCPDGTTNETILVVDNEGNEYELTRFIARHGDALVVEWQQPEAQIDHEVEGRTDLDQLRQLRRGPIFAQMIDGQVASFVGLQRHLENPIAAVFRPPRFAGLSHFVTNELGLHAGRAMPARPPFATMRTAIPASPNQPDAPVQTEQPHAADVDRRSHEISAAGEVIHARVAAAAQAGIPIHSITQSPMNPRAPIDCEVCQDPNGDHADDPLDDDGTEDDDS